MTRAAIKTPAIGEVPSAPPRLSRALRALRDGLAAAGDRATPLTVVTSAGSAAPIDFDDLSRRFRDRRKLVVKMLTLFRAECARGVDELRGRIDRVDLAEASATAHRVKGAAASASARAVRDAAAAVEEACRLDLREEVIAAFAELERASAQTAAQIEGELARDDAGPPGQGADRP